MQLNGKIGIAIVVLVFALGFGSGFLIGHQHPAHSFQRFGESHFVLDTTSGLVCDPFKDPKGNPIDQALESANQPPTPNIFDKPAQSNYPPSCGK